VNLDRAQLARWWGVFVLLWCGAAGLLSPVNYLACSAENAGPEDGSARASYCDGMSDFFSSGEPSEWTTPLPYLLPIAALAAVGGYGVWRRSKHFLSRAAVAAAAALAGHVLALVVLPG
jgi:hypothetical protein